MTMLTIHDESISGSALGQITLEILAERITVEELIRSRVFQEAKDAQAKQTPRTVPARRDAIVEPTEIEVALNGSKGDEPQSIDWKREFEKAVEAFRANRVLILIDGQQAISLDEVVSVNCSTDIRFLRLTMLMGG